LTKLGPVRPVSALPQLGGTRFVTDGGMETDLIFHHGVDLPEFAAFPLLDTAEGRALLRSYYDDYAAIARRAGAGLMLESPTWRANPEWAAKLGYGSDDLARVDSEAIALLSERRERYRVLGIEPILVSGTIGPRGDGYSTTARCDPGLAADYHRPQLEAFAAAGADLATAYTLTEVGEAIGITLAARATGLPIAISFTVETCGRLPSGPTIGEAITAVDRTAAPDYYLINCAHPVHISNGLGQLGPWAVRIVATRVNASLKSHAELDDTDELDEGDIDVLVAGQAELAVALPALAIVGGCCGTDYRHVAAIWNT
jgi:homocysteine S-methyltransferase